MRWGLLTPAEMKGVLSIGRNFEARRFDGCAMRWWPSFAVFLDWVLDELVFGRASWRGTRP